MRVFVLSFIAFAQAVAQLADNPTLVSTDWLARHLSDPSLVVVQVVHDAADFRMGHIPGARELPYDAFTTSRDGNGTELPDAAELQRLFERLGVSDDSHVVIYTGMTGMAPMAARAFVTLDAIGLSKVSLLDGGLARWRAEGRPTDANVGRVTPGHLTRRPHPVTVDAQWVAAHVGKRGIAFIDTRTDPEYLGQGERHGLRSDGHIAGARQLQWEALFADADSSLFLPREAIAKLYADRSAPGDTIVTYCLVGYRASMTYFGARLLGLPVLLYDGSYQDWSRRALPVRKGELP